METVLLEVAETPAPAFEAAVEHWAKARIEAPLRLIGRFDETAKQLIAVAGLLEGLLIAITTFEEPHAPFALLFAAHASLFVMAGCALAALSIQSRELGTLPVYDALRYPNNPQVRSLECLIHDWCGSIDFCRRWKSGLVLVSAGAFAISLVLAMVCLGHLANQVTGR